MLYCAAISTRIYQALYKSITSPSRIILKKDNTTQTDNYKLSSVKKKGGQKKFILPYC